MRLEVPEEHTKGEDIRESPDRSTAGLTLVWYNREDGEPEGEELDVEPIVDRLADEVLSKYPVAWTVSHEPQDLYTFESYVKLRWADDAEMSTAAADTPADTSIDPYQVSMSIGGTDFQLYTHHGTDWEVLRAGEPVESDLEGVAAAFGALVQHGLDELTALGMEEGNPSATVDMNLEFMSSIVDMLLASPIVTDEAREHLITFVEMVTGHEVT